MTSSTGTSSKLNWLIVILAVIGGFVVLGWVLSWFGTLLKIALVLGLIVAVGFLLVRLFGSKRH